MPKQCRPAEMRRWWAALGAITAAGLVLRLAAVLIRPHLAPAGDPAEYLGQANLLAEGKGWIEPIVYAATHHAEQTAKLPPLYTLALALLSLAGPKSFLAHRLYSCALNVAAVPLAGLLGRDLAGARVGLAGAALVAAYPEVWMPATIGMSESISPVLVLAVLVLAYRAMRSTTRAQMLGLGAAVGLAALARDELVVLYPLVVVPLVLGVRRLALRARLSLAAWAALGVVVVVGPWVAFNTARFGRPVLISDRLGATVASANCDQSWHGPLAGYWSMDCALAAERNAQGNEAARDDVALGVGLRYVERHLSGLPLVELERLGRTFGFYRPGQQLALDVHVEGRPEIPAVVGMWAYYLMLVPASVGLVELRRRRVPIYPLAAVVADVAAATLVAYGQTRFRATAEPVLCVLACVGLGALWVRVRTARAHTEALRGARGRSYAPGKRTVGGGLAHSSLIRPSAVASQLS